MGLGTVLRTDHRVVEISFPATGETRIYAKQTAPLTRVRFSVGDAIHAQDGRTMNVARVEEVHGLINYHGNDEHGEALIIAEGELNDLMQLNGPADRLLTGQIDSRKWFSLRRQTREHIHRLAKSSLYGLVGTRTSLIPHQLYIAHEVANRHAPRVLLADEVGLGKTIEAGLVIHHLLLNERAQRVLVVVPEALVHQWLVEMLRKFNLLFSVFDEERCEAISVDAEDPDTAINPFETEQLVLCSLDFLTANEDLYDQALSARWDCLVVDEAHHLAWSPEHSSIEYDCIEQLALSIPGVLLLTATPEQLGKTGHYARLRLLDPDRFPDFASFAEEQHHYAPIADTVDNLAANTPLTDASLAVLNSTLAEGDNRDYLACVLDNDADEQARDHARARLINHLLDRHGTGRVLFRNTRHAITGFPDRRLHAYPLPLPAAYADMNRAMDVGTEELAQLPNILLCPERLFHSAERGQRFWQDVDPRLPWLLDKLQALHPDKVLLITAHAQTALDIAAWLQQQSGIHAAVFHEHLSIIERDRAAAFFADNEKGAQVLICSEIGSEGRNFQFSHHLVLFDLPLNPDLLEQRIGRLDRIGQQYTIDIHVPYIEDSAQAVMLHWYQEGLQAFEHPCTVGTSVFSDTADELTTCLVQHDETRLATLVDRTRALYNHYNSELQHGRDRLLEMSSCRKVEAERLIDEALDLGDEKLLSAWLDKVFDSLGINSDIHSHTSLVITPGEHIRASLPGLDEDGLTVTTNRQTALSNEDIEYLSWEHPLVRAAMDTVVSTEMGNTSMVTIKHSGLEQGTLLVECLYSLETAYSQVADSRRYLPESGIRIVIDHQGNDRSALLADEIIESTQSRIGGEIITKVIQMHGATLRDMLGRCKALANQQLPSLVRDARQRAETEFRHEIDRLVALQTVNPNIRDDEIEYLRVVESDMLQRLDESLAQLDAVRVMIVI